MLYADVYELPDSAECPFKPSRLISNLIISENSRCSVRLNTRQAAAGNRRLNRQAHKLGM
jgi:hypothetical protein